MVQVLLECGVDVNSNNMFSCNPFYPSHEGHRIDPRVAQLLIAHGADPNIPRGIGYYTPWHREWMLLLFFFVFLFFLESGLL
jgi:hypothetical protein